MRRNGCGVFTIAALGLSSDVLSLPLSIIDGESTDNERRYPIPSTDGVNIDRSAQVIVVRFANKVYAMALACPHENAAVKWVAKDRRFQCTKHDSKYTPEGTYTSGHATRNLDRFPIRRDGDFVLVTTDRVYRSDQNQPAWNTAAVAVL